jgi:hypothetical protein
MEGIPFNGLTVSIVAGDHETECDISGAYILRLCKVDGLLVRKDLQKKGSCKTKVP